MEEARRLRSRSPVPPVSPIKLPTDTTTTNILHILRETDEGNNRTRAVTPINDFDPEPSENRHQQRPVAAVGYENERNIKNSQPLISMNTSPPRVIKRKSPNAPTQNPSDLSSNTSTVSIADAKKRQSGSNYEIHGKNNKTVSPSPRKGNRSEAYGTESMDKNKSVNILSCNTLIPPDEAYSMVRPRPRASRSPNSNHNRIPDVTIIPETPERRLGKPEDRQNLVKIAPKSPRPNISTSPRRGGGWL